MRETTFCLIKNDAIEKGLIGEIISRFENEGFQIQKMKMIKPTREIIEQHYPAEEIWLEKISQKAKQALERYSAIFNNASYQEIGLKIREWIIRDMTGKEVIAIILKGEDAVIRVKLIAGNTDPGKTLPGTVRNLSNDSIRKSLIEQRAVRNLMHCADKEKVEPEIKLWFPELF